MTGPLYHGTAFGDAIEANGFETSTAGGGQMGLRGVWLSADLDDARGYAYSARRRAPESPSEILVVEISADLRVADLRDFGLGRREAWLFVGLDLFDDGDLVRIREYNADPFGFTAALRERGYDAALIRSTIRKGGPDEICVFDPARLRVAERRTV